MATLEKILVSRKCNLQGRTGDFALVRKNVKQTNVRPVLADGQLGPEETVDTALVTNERKYEAPKAPKEEKEYEADRPERKICLIKDRGDKRYHLLRQGADFTKILEVGQGGKGEWVNNDEIAERFTVPSGIKPKYTPRQPVRICQVQGREGNFLLLRQTIKGTRIIGPIIGDNYGETVDNSLITGEQTIVLKRNKKEGEQGTVTETAVIVASEAPEAHEPPNIPQEDSPLHGHHPVVDEYSESDQYVAEPVQQAPVQQAPVQQAPVQPHPVQQRPQQSPQQPQRPQQPQQPQQQPQRPQQPQQQPQRPQQPPQQAQPQQRPDPRFQPGARTPQQVPQRPAPVR